MDNFKKEEGSQTAPRSRRTRTTRSSSSVRRAEPVYYKSGSSSSSYGESRRGQGYNDHRNSGEHSFSENRGSFDRRPYGQGRSNGYDNGRRSYGEGRNSYGEGRGNSYGEKRSSYGESRSSYGDRRPSYGQGRSNGYDSGRSNYGENRRDNGEGRSSYGESRSSYGDRRPSYGQGRPGNRTYGSHKPAFKGENKRGGFARKGNWGDGTRAPKRTFNTFNRSSEEGINKMISRRPQLDASYEGIEAVPETVKEEVRLNKFIANSGVCSRREADTMIQAGVVTVNGEVVTELGTKINIFTDDVRFNGERLKGEEKVYLVMNKPKGYVTTASDPHADKTVMDLLKGCETRVYPVGRLDKATTGVLMFTNDGELAERLTHPSYDKKKIYQVILDKPLAEEDKEKILEGVELSDGIEKADSLEYIDENDHRKLGIEIHSGKNRVVRRLFEASGYEVRTLDRVYFAGLTKKGLKKGEWRYLTESEASILKMGAYL